MTIGAEKLLKMFDGDRVAIAIALFDGTILSYEQEYANELLNKSIRWAAELRIKLREKHEKA
jgi:hypothetical protein